MKPSLLLFAASTGPVVVDVLGYNLPVLSALSAGVCVTLAYVLCPPSARQPTTLLSCAMVTLFLIVLLAAQITFQQSLLISICWAIALGYSGRMFLEEFGARVIERLRALIEVLFPFLKKDSLK